MTSSSIGCWLLRPESKNHALIHKGGDTRRFTLWYILLSDNDYLPLLWSGRTNLVRHPGLGEHWGSHNVAWYPHRGEGRYLQIGLTFSVPLYMVRTVYMVSYNICVRLLGVHLPSWWYVWCTWSPTICEHLLGDPGGLTCQWCWGLPMISRCHTLIQRCKTLL